MSTIGAMLGEIVHSLTIRPATESYPFVRYPEPERLRGKLVWDPQKCTGCQLCVKDCPSDALELMVIDKATKRFVLRYHIDRCTFCAQCVVNCRFDCIGLSNEEWELASLTKQPFEVYYGREEDVQILMERIAQENAGPSQSE
jgi:formate hydrogenlyase subunit 6/NADH:ubiquinone oxidoreductase subunit I